MLRERLPLSEFKNPKEYFLAPEQKKFIHPLGDGYEDDSPPESPIEDKVDLLDELFQQLFDSIAFLNYGGYLDDIGWDDFAEITPRAADTYRSDAFLTQPEAQNTAVQFGFDIGSMIKLLFGDKWPDIARGIQLGLLAEEPQHVDQEEETLAELDRPLYEAQPRQQLAEIQQQSKQHFFDIHGLNSDGDGFADVIEKGVTDVGLYPAGPLCHAIGDATSFRRGKLEVRDAINDLLDTTELDRIDELYENIRRDAETILNESTDAHIKGIDARDVLHAVADQSVSGKPRAIAEEATGTAQRDNLATSVLHILTKDDSEKPCSTEYSIVQNRHGDWSLTSYGALVYFEAFGTKAKSTSVLEDDSPLQYNGERLYLYAIDPSLLSDDEYALIEDALDDWSEQSS